MSDTEILTYLNTDITPDEVQIETAKTQELSDWKYHNVYKEVPDVGQDRVSVRWIVTS